MRERMDGPGGRQTRTKATPSDADDYDVTAFNIVTLSNVTNRQWQCTAVPYVLL